MFTLLRVTVFLITLCFWLGVGATPAIYNTQTQILTIPSLTIVDENLSEVDLNVQPQSRVVIHIKDYEVLESTPLFCRFSPINLGCELWEK